MSRIERIFPPVFLPGIYPDYNIQPGSNCFILSAMTFEVIFSSTFKREIDLHFVFFFRSQRP